jgi:hypothetical protein
VKSKEPRLTLGDFDAMGHLGNYYAKKIARSADLALYNQSGNAEQKEFGRQTSARCVGAVEKICRGLDKPLQATTADPDWLFRLKSVDCQAERDIAMAEGWNPHSSI